ncbi:GNAT family N-acetyltransferase [Cohnella lupini]|uniref:Acetyltransferase (GNAT) family protein n=1 Tax=Cohnella lupini TaxID=1294267 RepID=A0A3D9I4N8_9BACL|nr:GNAT family N-acetyltransferase [Cohnella lupini]RED56717.1 acetyltransferase (GNAT) family protein [Cohnella lupini]
MEVRMLDIRDKEIAEEIWALQHPAYRVEAELIGVSELPPLSDTVASIQACGETFLGCRDAQGDLVGAISYEKEKDGRFTICRVMVDPGYHRQGIGKQLLQRLLAEQSPGALWSVTAEVRNIPAIGLYERFGFVGQDTFSPMQGIELLRLVRYPRE